MTENTQVKMPTVDCLELVIPFLIFDSEDDFYFLQILQRKKENENLGSNSRAVKNYYIKSVDVFGLCVRWGFPALKLNSSNKLNLSTNDK